MTACCPLQSPRGLKLHGKSPDLDSRDILNRSFWSGLLKEHSESAGIAVRKRGGLL